MPCPNYLHQSEREIFFNPLLRKITGSDHVLVIKKKYWPFNQFAMFTADKTPAAPPFLSFLTKVDGDAFKCIQAFI